MPLIQLLSSKQPAYCPSWERKKNASRERFWYDVRLKMAENATETTRRRTADKTSVENTAKTKTAMTDALSLPSSGTKRGMVPVARGILIINCGRSKIRESKGWSTGKGCSGQKGKTMEAALRPGSSKE